MNEKVVKCPICGKIYEFYSMMVGDQSVCPQCRSAAKQAIQQPFTPKQDLKRTRYFGDC